MNLIVIHERDHDDNDKSVVGVADSIKNAESIIAEYYGSNNYRVISFQDIRDSSLEYSKVIEIEYEHFETSLATLTLEWFTLNKA
jgi:hypothetical protein|tara:strand:- start:322 stop:576 length:255 start_codon:yes stop_codon:yes gene_type:complete